MPSFIVGANRALLATHPAFRALHHPEPVNHSLPRHAAKEIFEDPTMISVDLVCNVVGIIVLNLSDSKKPRRESEQRVAQAARESRENSARHRRLCVMLYCDEAEPDLDFLTWINLLCVEHFATLVPVWTEFEAMKVFSTLATADIAPVIPSADAANRTAARAEASGDPIENVRISAIRAFTNIPNVRSNDVASLLTRNGTVADLLKADPAKLKCPGFTKDAYLRKILETELPTTSLRFGEVAAQMSQHQQSQLRPQRFASQLPNESSEAHVNGVLGNAARSALAARAHFEDEDDDEVTFTL